VHETHHDAPCSSPLGSQAFLPGVIACPGKLVAEMDRGLPLHFTDNVFGSLLIAGACIPWPTLFQANADATLPRPALFVAA
jgi:hypothetical protein